MAKQAGYLGNLTPKQEEALEAFRKAIPAELQKHKFEKEDLELWAASLSDLENSFGVKEKVVLLKYLRAREFEMEKSLEMIVNTLKWRKEFNVKALSGETFPSAFDSLGCVYGTDRNNQPVTYNFYGTLDSKAVFEDQGGIDMFVRWRVQLMERAIERLDFENGREEVAQIHDYAGASMMSMDKSMKAASKTIIALFQDHYPEFLSKKLFINVPFVMEKLYAFFSILAPPRTRAKFTMISAGNVRSSLIEMIDPTNLPSKYGGFATSEDKPIAGVKVEKVHVKAGSKETVNVEIPAGTEGGKEVKVLFVCDFGDIKAMTGGNEANGNVERKEFGHLVGAADGQGKVAVVFDNSFSYWNGKTVYYTAITITA
eukprot:comp20584_c0_seq1/m.26510 comp20584_c0_seq1/g.26510  ORF comp20584_c0_seq1/g.26510 comp20584_c0_seq1/m.26510 type:complete len:371 (-) comp20584_c0_seq1:207-1319(-)